MQLVVIIGLLATVLQICHGLTANHLAEQCYQRWYHVPQLKGPEQMTRNSVYVSRFATLLLVVYGAVIYFVFSHKYKLVELTS